MRRQVEQILGSPDFDASPRSRDFLCFIVEEHLAGHGDELTQGIIATRVFGRKDDFDALLDPIVRIQAGRLRRSIERYYLLGGKNDAVRIELPKGSYVPAFRKTSRSEPHVGAPNAGLTATYPSAPGEGDPWPAIAVIPFEADSTDRGQEAAVRLSDELMLELGRYQDVRVVPQVDAEGAFGTARRAGRFELRGRIRPEDEGWLITARLVDRTTGRQVWGDGYHTSPAPGRWRGTPDDVARVIAARVGAEHGVIVQALAGEYRKRPQANAGPYGALLSSYRFFFDRDLRDFAPAVAALRKVVGEDPEIALAWTQLARLYQVNYAFELTEMETSIDEAVTFAHQGVRLDPSSARTRCVLAAALLNKGELAAGRDELEQALRLSPGSLVYSEIIGWLLALLGDWDRGIAMVRRAMERNPHHMMQCYVGLWADHLRRGEFDEAYRAALEYRDPTFFWRSLMRASCLGHLGREGEARSQVVELLEQKPSFEERGRILIGHYIKPVELQERVAEGLRKAGLNLR